MTRFSPKNPARSHRRRRHRRRRRDIHRIFRATPFLSGGRGVFFLVLSLFAAHVFEGLSANG